MNDTIEQVQQPEIFYRGNRDEAWFQTYTGKRFHLLSPSADEIDIFDIAHALSLSCRFTGHCKKFYSVADHSIRVSKKCPKHLKFRGLMHDATEAYICDLCAPLKHSGAIDQYCEIEGVIQAAIYDKYGIDPSTDTPVLKAIDRRMCASEWRDLSINPLDPDWLSYLARYGTYEETIVPMSPQKCERIFLERFQSLSRGL